MYIKEYKEFRRSDNKKSRDLLQKLLNSDEYILLSNNVKKFEIDTIYLSNPYRISNPLYKLLLICDDFIRYINTKYLKIQVISQVTFDMYNSSFKEINYLLKDLKPFRAIEGDTFLYQELLDLADSYTVKKYIVKDVWKENILFTRIVYDIKGDYDLIKSEFDEIIKYRQIDFDIQLYPHTVMSGVKVSKEYEYCSLSVSNI